MITEDYVSFEVAKLLKEKGFNEGCSFIVNAISKGVIPVSWPTTNSDIEEEEAKFIALPTLQMAMKWLREVHKAFISIIYENDGVFTANLKVPLKGVDCMIDNKHNCWLTYEEAVEASIKYYLENLI